MKRQVWASAVTLFIVSSLSVGAAIAQPPGGGFGGRGGRMGMMGRGGGMMMLQAPAVQKELKLTPDQISKLQTKQEEMRNAMREMFQNGSQDPEERQKRMAEMQDLQKKAVAEILDASQQKRFHELELQQQGPAALLTNSEAATELKVTDDQKKQMEDIQQKSMEEMRAAMQGQDFQSMTQEERTKAMTKMQDMRKAVGDKMLAVLTPDQQKQWKTMIGEPFKFPPMGFGGRGGFGGGRRGQGGPGGNGQ